MARSYSAGEGIKGTSLNFDKLAGNSFLKEISPRLRTGWSTETKVNDKLNRIDVSIFHNGGNVTGLSVPKGTKEKDILKEVVDTIKIRSLNDTAADKYYDERPNENPGG